MSMQSLFISIIEAFHFIFDNCHTYNKVMSSKELVVKLGKGMGVSDCIEPLGMEEGIHNSEVTLVYLQQGGLLSYMDGTGKHAEIVSM